MMCTTKCSSGGTYYEGVHQTRRDYGKVENAQNIHFGNELPMYARFQRLLTKISIDHGIEFVMAMAIELKIAQAFLEGTTTVLTRQSFPAFVDEG